MYTMQICNRPVKLLPYMRMFVHVGDNKGERGGETKASAVSNSFVPGRRGIMRGGVVVAAFFLFTCEMMTRHWKII